MSIFFNYSKADGSYMPTMAGYVLLVAVLLAILIIGAALTGRGRKASAKQIAFSGVAIALGTVTSMIKIFEFPMGGSLTLFSMLFVTLVGYWYGTRAGITASVAYGILQLVLWPYIYSLVYNGIYLGAEAGITLVLLAIKPVRDAMTSVKKLATE